VHAGKRLWIVIEDLGDGRPVVQSVRRAAETTRATQPKAPDSTVVETPARERAS
jgi:hypothetical protein